MTRLSMSVATDQSIHHRSSIADRVGKSKCMISSLIMVITVAIAAVVWFVVIAHDNIEEDRKYQPVSFPPFRVHVSHHSHDTFSKGISL